MSACKPGQQAENKLEGKAPPKILWAWESPQDLRFLNTKEYGVAFLAQTLTLRGDYVEYRPRRQQLEVKPETYLIAVTRIETAKTAEDRPKFHDTQRAELLELILRTLMQKNIAAIQIDFDAAESERPFYKRLLSDVAGQLPPDVPLSMTALASWCVNKGWLSGLPVDEAVPMAFRMGADDRAIRGFLAAGKDLGEPLCRRSYGFSLDEHFPAKLQPNRRLYLFKNGPWNERDIAAANNYYE